MMDRDQRKVRERGRVLEEYYKREREKERDAYERAYEEFAESKLPMMHQACQRIG